jgi:hypothetical protein
MSCSSRKMPMSCSSRKIKGPPNRGGPTLTPRQATTLISRDAHSRSSCAICRSQLTACHLTFAPFAPVLAPPATRITRQCKRNNANRGKYANGKDHPKPVVVHCRRPVSTNTNTSAAEAISPAELIRKAPGTRRRIRRVGKRTHKAPPAKRNGQPCENLQMVPSGVGCCKKN